MDSVQAVDQRQQSQAIVDAMADAVIVVDAGGRITDFNPAARDLLGEFAIADRPLSGFVELLRPAASNGDPVRTEELPPVRALAGEVVREWECSAVLPAGERQLTLSASPIRDPRGTILGAVTVLRDVTAARLAERAQDRFLSVASHELKTPLSPLRIYIQYLQRQIEKGELQPDELDHALGRMDAQVARLALLIDDLLDIGRLREGRLALRCEAVDLVALARQVVDRLQAELRLDDTDSREIRVEAGADTLPGSWDPRRLDQVLTNLLSNALKYSPAGSPVTVRLDRADGWARLSIRDHGIGIPADEHEHLFRPFQRGRNAPAMYAGGLGLGLSISKGIVDRHGGRIRAESREDEGSTFTVELPADAD